MKAFRIGFIIVLTLAALGTPILWYIEAGREENDPDFPAGEAKISKDEYLRQRDEYFALIRGLDTTKQDSRGLAIREMEAKENALRAIPDFTIPAGAWRALGPAPIPNGQTTGRTDPVSGRTVSIAIHPTNPNIVFAGTAQGGLYRSLNGGSTWTPLLDSALTLAVGSVAFAPSNPSVVFVGTGEPSLSADSFFGAGVYRIDNADSPNPTVSGPFNRDGSNADVLTGRSTGRILVHPTDPNIVFIATVSGVGGLGTTTGAVLPARGLYRMSNAMSASPTFTRLTVSATSNDRPMLDAVMEPGNPNHMFVSLIDSVGAFGDGGVYYTENALDASPTFTRLLTTGSSSELGRTELAIQKTANTVTVYAAAGTGSGQVFKTSYDGSVPGTPPAFTMTVDNNFCNGQCFYDQAIAVDPNDATRVYLAGSPTLPFGISTNGGTSFVSSSTGLHVDSHTIAVAPSQPTTIFFGSDGGVWKSIDSGATWVAQNNSTFSATQFESVAVHPADRHYTLGGTQDNGTEYLFPDGTTWTRSVGGDGGPALIDSNSSSPTTTVAYHTFFNSTNSQIGFSRATTTQSNGNPIWGGLLGCGGTANGINCADATLFYAPMVLGPNAPGSTGNTVYFGTNKLYRSINQGTLMTPVSQTLLGANERVSAIGIAPSTDDIRVIGSTLGKVYRSTAAAAVTMDDITGTIPARYVARIAIDPTNPNVAYVAMNGYGIPNQHVMKTTNLTAPTPTWTNSGIGIPDVPTNGIVIDPAEPSVLYAGTDIGVFRSEDGGANWAPFSNGLPRVAVFEIVFQASKRVLKIATHGRGIYEFDLANSETPFDFDGDSKTDISIFRPSVGEWWINRSSSGVTFAAQFGTGTDVIAPRDFTGDGKADMTFFRPSTGEWYVLRSEDFSYFSYPFGTNGDIPAPNDYDADGKADAAVFRPSTSTWYVRRSSDQVVNIETFGTSGDVPVAADYDGDGRADIAIYRPSLGQWWVKRSVAGVIAFTFGGTTDKPVQGDYTGDGRTDVAFWRPSTGEWFVLRSQDFSYYSFPFGLASDIPTPGDYDGDGRSDGAVFRPSNATWYVQRTTAGSLIQQFGLTGDRAVPNAFVP